MMELFDWGSWPNLYPMGFHRLAGVELEQVIESSEFLISASPVCHLIPTIGLRIESIQSRKIITYSCDTEPCQEVVRLAQNADILIHEATGAFPGHTTSFQAGEIAQEAEVGALYLIHYPTDKFNTKSLVNEAQETFGRPVSLAEDYLRFEL
jgi:ribonuclease Z